MKQSISLIFKTITAVLIPFIVYTLIDILTEITGGKIGDFLHDTFNIRLRWFVLLLFILLILSVIHQIYEALKTRKTGNPQTLNDNIEPDIKLLFDSLTERYKKRYDSKLDGRFEITLEVSEDFDSLNPRSITEQFSENATKGIAIEVIREAFERKGRLLIVGNPGVGKTVLLLKLAIDLLDKIKDLEKEPFPVIFNLASWSEEYKNFDDWLNAMLVTNYGFYKKYAKELLKQGKIIFLLDGWGVTKRRKKPQRNVRNVLLRSTNTYATDAEP